MHNNRIRHIRPRNTKSTHSPFRTNSIKKILGSDTKGIFFRILGAVILIFTLGFLIMWAMFLRDLPPIENLEKGEYFRDNTVIYARDNTVIYTLFRDGKRTYVNYDAISQPIKDAIIATEDKTFFENPGIDFMGLVRVGVSYVTNGKIGGRIGGASTISQQLIKNTLLTNEVSLKRKVQEAVLSYQMNQKYSKAKILEMYLNAFSFGYNANGIEQASQTYFGKSAKEVGPFGAAILASLPQAPTKYSPYNNRDRLMGKLEVYTNDDPSHKKVLVSAEDRKAYAPLYNDFKSYLSGMTMTRENNSLKVCNVKQDRIKDRAFSVGANGCLSLDFRDVTNFIGHTIISKNITASGTTEPYIIEYTVGRKDLVASFMLEDNKIDGETFKKIVYDGLEFEFKRYTENIKYPYFVMYVKEYLESKYGKDIDVTSGLKVYTTLDPKLQEFAEDAVRKQIPQNKSQYGASSAALISMDNVSGKLLAMVGGPDYFDIENGGNNNMTTATTRQPGSSFKPIVYSLAIAKNAIGPASPVADVYTKFGNWDPDNYDRRFNGIMTLETALDYSRNIPAVKMYYLAGQEAAIAKYGRGLGLSTLKDDGGLGAPMAIGTATVKPIDMMQAYSVFANNGIKKKLHFIEKIEDSASSVIEQYKDEAGEEVASPAASYIVSNILSNENARPESSFWRNGLAIPGRKVAAKTGTSNKPRDKNDRIFPGDLWTVGYTPQITTVVWAGNVDGSPMKGGADGLTCAAPIWKSFMTFALKDLPKEDFKRPDGVYDVVVSKLTGLLAGKDTPDDLTRKTIMAVKPDKYDDGVSSTEIDTLCGGPVTPDTPSDAIPKVYKPSGKPIIDGYDPSWYTGFLGAIGMGTASGSSTQTSKEPCFRPKTAGEVTLNVTPNQKTLSVNWSGNRIIEKLIASEGGKIVKTLDFGSGGQTSGTAEIDIGSSVDNVIVQAVDVYGYRYSAGINTGGLPQTDLPTPIAPGTHDANAPAPTITMTNPRGTSLSLYAGDMFNLRFQTKVNTTVREIDVSIDGKTVQSATSGDVFIFPISSAGLSSGKHTVTISVKDANMHTAVKNFSLNILPR